MLRTRQRIGKYRILGRIASGPLADVYRAQDTIQKIKVALKIPKAGDGAGHEEFLHEVRVATRLRHPNILSVLNASYIDDKFVIAMELGEESLADRLERRISTARALDLSSQALASMAHAHENKIIHCDIKPENFILFAGDRLKLADFGFAKLNLRTLKASGSGTIDYIAPEQAMGRPKFQSDVFSLGLVVYRPAGVAVRVAAGGPGETRGEGQAGSHRGLETRDSAGPETALSRCRADALGVSEGAEHGAKAKALETGEVRQRRAGVEKNTLAGISAAVQVGARTRHSCRRCEGPVAESMQFCPWCGFDNPARGSESRMPSSCRAASAASRTTGTTAPGVTGRVLSKKPAAPIRTNATVRAATTPAAVDR